MRKLIGKKSTKDKTGLSDSTIWREEREGRFPQRVQISPNRVGWYEDEINDWIESRPRMGTAA